jgi:hypothetical protein
MDLALGPFLLRGRRRAKRQQQAGQDEGTEHPHVKIGLRYL